MTQETRRWVIRAVVALLITVAAFVALFRWFPHDWYDWMKSIHVLAIISWMAGMLYLPRLFVYHCGAEPGSKQSETFKVMERRLLVAIINPAMIVSWVSGIWLGSVGEFSRGIVLEGDTGRGLWLGSLVGFEADGWYVGKVLLVLVLSAIHGMLSRWTRDFAHDRNRYSHVFYRAMNEVPTVLMIGIVILVIVKPF